MKLPSRAFIRSVSGQLTLLGGTFVGAVVLAVTALLLRDRLFEPYIKEKYPPLEGRLLEVARELAGADLKEKDREKLEEEVRKTATGIDAVYGGLILSRDLDRQGRLAQWLIRRDRADLLGRLRRTLTVGNEEQRGGALRLLGRFADGKDSEEVVELAHQARERARRRGEAALVEEADSVLAYLKGRTDEHSVLP
jgi:hypothetical protein